VRDYYEKFMRKAVCPACKGARLNGQALAVRLSGKTICELSALSIQDALRFFDTLELSATQQVIARDAIKEIRARLGFLCDVGLDYLNLDRAAPTLSGGESQRIRLASQIGAGLVGVLYVLDEPSIGLHPRDNQRLLDSLCRLRDMGNTVIVVEHDEQTMRTADHIVDFGPGPGVRGGEVVAEGNYEEVVDAKRSVTGQFLRGEETIEIPKQRRPVSQGGRPPRRKGRS
jgi:excinuclease ABC subunit A